MTDLTGRQVSSRALMLFSKKENFSVQAFKEYMGSERICCRASTKSALSECLWLRVATLLTVGAT